MMPALKSESTTVEVEDGIALKELHYRNPKSDPDVVVSGQGTDDDDGDEGNHGCYVRVVGWIERSASQFYARHRNLVIRVIKALLLLLYGAYFGYCMYYRFGDEGSIVLVVGTGFFVIYLCYKLLLSKGYKYRMPGCLATCKTSRGGKRTCLGIRYGLYVVATAALCLFLGLDILRYHPQNSQSIIGVVVLVLITLLFSTRPSRVNWHPVFWGFIVQFACALLTLRTAAGYIAFKWLGDVIQTLVDFSDAGSAFVIGEDFDKMGLLFSSGGIMIFFNAIISLLNHWGILEVIIVRVGMFLSMCLETGPVESVTAAANIFLSLVETPFLIRPYFAVLSRSELCAIMTCGFASISGGILGLFLQYGAPANHLLTAAVISAPAALAFSKLACPETEAIDWSSQKNVQLRDKSEEGRNALAVCADGATSAVKTVSYAYATLMAFVSVITMINAILDWFGQRAGVSGLSFEMICSYVLYPLSYVMGVAPEDCGTVATLIGVKLFATPMVGYVELGKIIKNREIFESYNRAGNGSWYWSDNNIILEATNTTLLRGIMSERSEVITTYAMCGFSAMPAIGVTMGLITSMCPSRKKDITDLVFTAFMAGNMASFATGAIAGVMFTDHSSTTVV